MGVVSGLVDLEFVEHLATERVLGKHPFDGLLDRKLGFALQETAVALRFETAGNCRVVVVMLLVELVARQLYLGSVHHDHKIAGVDMLGKTRLVLAAQHGSNLAC